MALKKNSEERCIVCDTCILCGKKELAVIDPKVRDSTVHRIVKCSNCGHVQLDPLPTIVEDKAFYDQDMQSRLINEQMKMEDIKKKSVNDWVRRVSFVKKKISPGAQILDIGAGYGFFVKAMQAEGYHVHGIELSDTRRQIASQYTGIEIYGLNLLTDTIPDEMKGKYQVVTLFQVLEHITQPQLFLKRIQQLLAPEGMLIVEVPNLQDHMVNSCQPYREFFWQRAHVSYFSPDVLKNLITVSGYVDIQIYGEQRYGLNNMMYWMVEGKPQIYNPSYETVGELKWLEEYYKRCLCNDLKCDTIIVIGTRCKI